MADIELVIKIPEEEYRWIKQSDKNVFADVASKECMLHAIKTGTPLPKCHGRLIDVNEITAFRELECNGHNIESIDEFTVIIEADKAESEEV